MNKNPVRKIYELIRTAKVVRHQVNRTKIGGLFRFALWNIKRFSQK